MELQGKRGGGRSARSGCKESEGKGEGASGLGDEDLDREIGGFDRAALRHRT